MKWLNSNCSSKMPGTPSRRTSTRATSPRRKQWLDLDQQELRWVEQTRNEFVRLSLENYLLSLAASDDHNNDALRFTAVVAGEVGRGCYQRRGQETHREGSNARNLRHSLNQLSSRLQDQSTGFQKLLDQPGVPYSA